jgi:uncharacterized protein (DUF433 family)
MLTDAKMDVIVNEGRDRGVYPGASSVRVSGEIPAYKGGITMTIKVSQLGSLSPAAELVVAPNIRGGVPCVSNGHEPVSHILEKLALGMSPDMIVSENPQLTLYDIQLALRAASWVMRDPAIEWQSLNLSGMIDFRDEMQAWQSLSDEAFGRIESDTEG